MDTLKFTIGGALAPSYRGALAQAEAEALRANATLQGKIRAQQMRLAAMDKAYLGAGPGSAAASAIAMQQYPARMKMEMELQKMQLKYNLLGSAAVRKAEAEKVAAAEKATAARILLAKKASDAQILSERLAEAAIVAAGRREIAEKEAVNLATLTNVARGYGAGLPSAHGQGGMTGIIRESLTIFREVAAGRGVGRIAGSVTLLAQYMGVLGKVVKSTASEQILASAAASKLSQAMAAEALAAKGTAAYAALSAAALKQEAVAADAATTAEIALRAARVSLNPVAGVLIAIGVAAGVLIGVILHFKHIGDAAKRLGDMIDPLRKKFTDMAEGERENAEAHREYLDWLKKIGSETESLPEKIDKVIKRMREQAEAQIELARAKGVSARAIELMEEDQLQRELQIVTLAKLRAQREQEDAMDAAAVADTKRQAFDPTNLKAAQDAAQAAGGILDTVQDTLRNTPTSTHFVMGPGPMLEKTTNTMDTKFDVRTASGQVNNISVNEAKADFDRLKTLTRQLADTEKSLIDKQSSTQMTAEEKRKATEKLQEQQADLLSELGIKQTTGRELAKYASRRPTFSGEGEMEKSGLFASAGAVRVHSVLEKQLMVQQRIEHNTRSAAHHARNSGTAYE